MAAYVFVVNKDTFPIHLKYMFAGTGAGEDGHENMGMISDISGCRKGDKIIFYVTQHDKEDGRFFGAFEVTSKNAFWQKEGNYLYEDLKGKRLTNRILIKPSEVYSMGVTEWDSLDNLDNLPDGGKSSANKMIWSLIYRKLEGQRGCTPILDYEYKQIINLIKNLSGVEKLNNVKNYSFEDELIKELVDDSFYDEDEITKREIPLINNINETTHSPEEKMVLVKKGQFKYKGKYRGNIITKTQSKCEAELEYFFVKSIGFDERLDPITGKFDELSFFGSQIFAGVGKRRIDVLTISKSNEIRLIELKDEEFSDYQLDQIKKYILWVKQYIREPKEKIILPTLVISDCNLSPLDLEKIKIFNEQNKGLSEKLKIFKWKIEEDKIKFEEVNYN